MSERDDPHRIELRIGRLVVDATSLGALSREALGEQVQAALTQAVAGAPPMPGANGLAAHIADAVAQQVRPRLPPSAPSPASPGAKP